MILGCQNIIIYYYLGFVYDDDCDDHDVLLYTLIYTFYHLLFVIETEGQRLRKYKCLKVIFAGLFWCYVLNIRVSAGVKEIIYQVNSHLPATSQSQLDRLD